MDYSKLNCEDLCEMILKYGLFIEDAQRHNLIKSLEDNMDRVKSKLEERIRDRIENPIKKPMPGIYERSKKFYAYFILNGEKYHCHDSLDNVKEFIKEKFELHGYTFGEGSGRYCPFQQRLQNRLEYGLKIFKIVVPIKTTKASYSVDKTFKGKRYLKTIKRKGNKNAYKEICQFRNEIYRIMGYE
eukprot:TRINITY_DN858_c0_g1_i1.p1 TRINITY_DN858_c0_g1~~TRINITY_DN858_c0_g1_i1.p1  ORF type:complete len:186 (+),score=8.60 TRINITY_DN858_c0_g1_i1:253-810(+)